MRGSSPRMTTTDARSGGSPEPLQRLHDLGAARSGFLALLTLAFDYLLGCASEEIPVGKLGIDTGDIGVHPRHFLFEPRIFGCEVDHSDKRQSRDFAPNDELHRSLR